MYAILTNAGAALIVIGVAIVVYQTGKNWPKTRRRAAKPDPNEAPKPGLPASGIIVIAIGALMVAAAASITP
jgi:formate hydrogenlyase subunit 3/multisubunit Na+/H+ antiporter MnhD subunit